MSRNIKVIEGKKNRKKFKILLYIAAAAVVVYIGITTISQQIQISQKEAQLAEIQQQLSVQNLRNDELKNALDAGLNASSEYIKRVARQSLDFAKPGERIFVNISGD